MGREVVSQAVDGSELAMGIMRRQKRPTSSSRSEQMQRDKLARRNQKTDGWGISLIFDDAFLTLFQMDRRLKSCLSFSILEYRRGCEVTVDWTGVSLVC